MLADRSLASIQFFYQITSIMKRLFTLMSCCLLAVATLTGQAVIINSPAELAGGYDFDAADFGADITSDIWTADAIFVDDGTEFPTQGCEAAINGDDLTGKIALIDRGSCEFGLKCLNAEEAGAIAAVVVNSAPGGGTIVMGAGAVGGQVTIPCVMIPFEVGQLIRTELVTGSVNMTIGNVMPPPPPANDLAVFNSRILVPVLGTIPASQVKNPGDFVFTPGVEVINRGTNDAPNYNINVTIDHEPFGAGGGEVYNESFSSSDALLAGDTTDLILFPQFDPVNIGEGIYTYNYSVQSDSTDDTNFNNSAGGTFTLLDRLIYSKASWDPALQQPRIIASTTIAGGGPIEFITPLEIKYGSNHKIDSIQVEVRLSGGLANVPVEGYVYEWNDDGDCIVALEELVVVGISFFTFSSDTEEDAANITLPVLDLVTFEPIGVEIPEDNRKYLVGVRYNGGSETVSFGFDSSIDYVRTEEWKMADSVFTDLDYGSISADEWDDATNVPTGFILFTGGVTSSTGVILTDLTSSTREPLADLDHFDLSVFPNPVSEVLTARLDFNESSDFLEFYIVNGLGQVEQRERRTNVNLQEQATFDVSGLPAGDYHLVLRTEYGLRAQSFVVAR